MLKKIKIFDLIICFFFLSAIVFSSISAYKKKGGEVKLFIQSPSGQWVYALDKNVQIDIPGSIGISRIVIVDGKASFSDSPCDNKTCITAKPISNDGEWSACLPNRVFIRIESTTNSDKGTVNNIDDDDSIDAIAQ